MDWRKRMIYSGTLCGALSKRCVIFENHCVGNEGINEKLGTSIMTILTKRNVRYGTVLSPASVHNGFENLFKVQSWYCDPKNYRRKFWNMGAYGQTRMIVYRVLSRWRQKDIAFTTGTFLDYDVIVLFISLLFRYDLEISSRNCSSCTCPVVRNCRL